MTRSGIRVGIAVAVVGFALAVTGCTAAASHPNSGSEVSPTPTATPAGGGKPSLSQLVASADGLGDLVLGAPVPTGSPATAILKYDPTKCVSAAEGIAAGAPGAGAWVPTYPNSLTYAGSGMPFDVGPVLAQADPVKRIAIWSPEIKTAKGVGVGSTAAQLKTAYGSALTVDTAANSDVYVLPGAHSELLFEVAKAGAGLPIEETGTVVWMHIVPLGDTPLRHANTDAAGVCSF